MGIYDWASTTGADTSGADTRGQIRVADGCVVIFKRAWARRRWRLACLEECGVRVVVLSCLIFWLRVFAGEVWVIGQPKSPCALLPASAPKGPVAGADSAMVTGALVCSALRGVGDGSCLVDGKSHERRFK